MRPPILWIAVGFGAGLWAGLGAFGPPLATLLTLAIPVFGGALLVRRRAPVAAAMGVASCAGLLWGEAAVAERAVTCAGRWEAMAVREPRTQSALVRLMDPVSDAGGVVAAVVEHGQCRGGLRLRWPAGQAARGGTAWVVAGRWLGSAAHGVLLVRRARALGVTARGRGAWRDRLARRSAALFGSRAPLVDALVLARRATLDAKTRERFARAGLAHLLAISGLHVGFLAIWVGVALRRLGLGKRSRVIASGACVVGYVALLGFPPPATRAAVMLVLGQIATLRQRVVAPRGVLALAAVVVLAIDPWAVRSVGAWLSLAAVAAVVWSARVAVAAPRWLRWILPAVAASIATAPITAFAFGTVAPIGVVLNLVAIPLAGIAVPGVFLAVLLAPVVPAVASLFAAAAGLGLALLDLMARYGAGVPGGHIVQAPGWGAAITWGTVAVGAWWTWSAPRRPWAVAARVAVLVASGAWVSVGIAIARDAPSGLAVYFLDVGQGDAIILRSPAGQWIVVDGGPRFGSRDAGRAVVVPFLRRRGVDALAAVVATHGDADHLGGLPSVVETFPPAYVLEPGEPLGRPLYLEFLAAVEASGAHWRAARTGDRLYVDGLTLDVLSPDSAWLAQSLDVNEHSVVLLVTYGASRLLLMGDAGLPVEARLHGQVGPVRLLKLGHHGSRTATSAAWLDELHPAEAVISVGARNRYGHPALEVLARLAARGIAVRRTDRQGTITFITDGTRAHSELQHH